jgi:hypothetical protein
MDFLTRAFGPSRASIWQQLAQEIDGTYLEGRGWHGDRVVATHDGWTVTLETEFNAASKTTHTRLSAPFRNPSGFHFTIYRRGAFTDLAKKLGMQDVEVGHAGFDRDFVIKGNDEHKLKKLFANAAIRALIEAQPEVSFTSEPPWSFMRDSDDVDELSFRVSGMPKDVARLKGLFDLFAETLDEIGTR